ncbi:MAG TPA: hypothetical protein VD772_13065, partial [Anseongella sp.]|nr:hypothetical protein [Anseongella sp.]
MKIIGPLFLSLFFLCTGVAATVAQSFQWARIGTGGEQNNAMAVAIDSSGNVYSTGSLVGSATSPNTFSGLVPRTYGSEDIYLVKYDSAGTIKWIKSAGGVKGDRAQGICVGSDGNIYIAGYVQSPSYLFDSVTHLQGDDATLGFLAKYDPSGNFLWVRRDTLPEHSSFAGVIAGHDGYIYVTGRRGTSSGKAFIAKYTRDGEQLWRNMAAGGGISLPQGLVMDAAGNLYTTGMIYGTLRFDTVE